MAIVGLVFAGLLYSDGCLLLHAADSAPAPQIVLAPSAVPDARFEVQGLSPNVLRSLRRLRHEDPRWKEIFAVYLDKHPSATRPPMLGTYEVVDDAVRFRPRFPLERGLEFRAVFAIQKVPGTSEKHAAFERTFLIPALSAEPRTRAVAVYPSSSVLPENLLRMYVRFSAPMSQGDSYRYIRLCDESGKAMEGAFLEVPQELWDAAGTRLTLLLDPGRVKTGLVPRDEVGPVLRAGHNYTLVIDGSWPDADGRPLVKGFTKKFRAGNPMTSQLETDRWQLTVPPAGSRQPLCVHFPRPLDEGMLERVLRVYRADDPAAKGAAEIAGTVRVLDEETRWTFTPTSHWAAGHYHLAAPTSLEDCSGNSIRMSFEVDLNRPHPPTHAPSVVRIEFVVQRPAR